MFPLEISTTTPRPAPALISAQDAFHNIVRVPCTSPEHGGGARPRLKGSVLVEELKIHDLDLASFKPVKVNESPQSLLVQKWQSA
jgi:hypothetical protein